MNSMMKATCMQLHQYYESHLTINHSSLPALNPGPLPRLYIELGETRLEAPTAIRDPEVELAERAFSSRSVPAPPAPPLELTKSGKPLTKKQQKEAGTTDYTLIRF